MARPRPGVMLEHVDTITYKIEQILEADAIYAVYYNDMPINIRTLNQLITLPSPKYKKCSFSNPGHAIHLSDRLNRLFDTDKFAVYKLDKGIKITTDVE